MLKRWTRLVQGLRIRKRLQEQYAGQPQQEVPELQPSGHRDGDDGVSYCLVEVSELSQPRRVASQGGGFLVAADDVVEAYHLPRSQYLPLISPGLSTAIAKVPEAAAMSRQDSVDSPRIPFDAFQSESEMARDDQIEGMEAVAPIENSNLPRTMRELAEDAARKEAATSGAESPEEHEGDGLLDPDLMSQAGSRSRNAAKASSARINVAGRSATNSPSPRKRRTSRPSAKKRGRASPDYSSEPEIESSPAKRSRGTASGTTPSQTRVLRPRAPKSATKVQEEKDLEMAFRRAIAE